MAGIFRRMIQTVDSHTEGNSTRVITGGYPIPPGRTLLERRAWLWRHDDGLRRMLNFEPRGHGMMCSVLLMPPIDQRADFSVIIMEQDEYVPMCGHCMIGTAMTVVATGMVPASEPLTTRDDRDAGGPGALRGRGAGRPDRRRRLHQRRSPSCCIVTPGSRSRGLASFRSTSPMAAIFMRSWMPIRWGCGSRPTTTRR